MNFATRTPMLVAGLASAVLILAVVSRWPLAASRQWKASSNGAVTAIALSSTADWLACGDESGEVVIQEAASGKILSRWTSSASPVLAIDLSAGDQTVAIGHQDGSVICRNVDTGKVLLQSIEPDIGSVQFSPNGRFLAITSRTGTIRVIKNLVEEVMVHQPAPPQPIGPIQFSPDSRFLAAMVGRRLELWNLKDHSPVMRTPEMASAILSLEFSADGSEIFAVPVLGEMTIWNTSDGTLKKTNSARCGPLYQSQADPEHQTLAVAALRGKVRLLDLEDGAELLAIQERGAETRGLAWSENGQWLALADADNQIHLWDLSVAGQDAAGRRNLWKTSWQRWSNIIAAGFLLCLAFTLLSAWRDWPAAVACCVILETFRDPILKLTGNLTVFLATSLVWLIVTMIAIYRSRIAIISLQREYPELKQALLLMLLALIPGAILSLIRFPQGWAIAAAGGCSYLLPFLGIAAGAACAGVRGLVVRLLVIFIGLSVLGSLTGLAESALWNVPSLGGRDFVWYRSFPRSEQGSLQTLPLICGLYRSPDALGLHAALGLMFVAVLTQCRVALRDSKFFRGANAGIGLAAVVLILGLLISGRRKMAAIVGLFGLTWLCTEYRRAAPGRIAGAFVIVLITVSIIAFTRFSPYLEYLQTVLHDAVPRVSESFAAFQVTWRQSGFWGRGLGAATQGIQPLVPLEAHIWQEDGLSRALVELGTPGLVLALIAFGLVGRAAWRAWRLRTDRPLVRGMLQVVLANLAGYFISHQIYSGDVPMLLWCSMCLGIALSSANPITENISENAVISQSRQSKQATC